MDKDLKNYPSSTDEISKLFKIEDDSDLSDTTVFVPTASGGIDLPVIEGQFNNDFEDAELQPQEVVIEVVQSPQEVFAPEKIKISPDSPKSEIFAKTKYFNFFKKLAPYLLVFVIGLFVYNFYFTDFSFLSLFNNSVKVDQKAQANALDKLITSRKSQYEAWMKQFYFDISDSAILDPYADNSGNGLTNFQKYLLNLNPKNYDTLGLGKPDGQTLLEGTDPATGKQLSDSKKKILEQYFDTEAISNKLALAGFSASNVLSQNNSSTQLIRSAQAQNTENITSLNVDTNIPAIIEIPKLNVAAPIIWTTDTKNFDSDLKLGLVHYPGTAIPGNIGTSYISGHSSNYSWVKSNYKDILVHLDKLSVNDTFTVTVTLHGGAKTKLHYVVKSSQEFQPTDQAQFANTAKSVVALSTCWPPGTTARRLVVFGELSQTENLR